MSVAVRARNFDAVRIVAAGSVISSHVFIIAEGHENNEPFVSRARGLRRRHAYHRVPDLGRHRDAKPNRGKEMVEKEVYLLRPGRGQGQDWWQELSLQ